MKKKLMLSITAIWLLLSGLHESGLLDILPFDDENLNKWVKWLVAFIVVAGNVFSEKISLTKHVGPRPPKPPGE